MSAVQESTDSLAMISIQEGPHVLRKYEDTENPAVRVRKPLDSVW